MKTVCLIHRQYASPSSLSFFLLLILATHFSSSRSHSSFIFVAAWTWTSFRLRNYPIFNRICFCIHWRISYLVRRRLYICQYYFWMELRRWSKKKNSSEFVGNSYFFSSSSSKKIYVCVSNTFCCWLNVYVQQSSTYTNTYLL